MRLLHERDHPPPQKGQSPVTAKLVRDALRTAAGPQSAAEIGIAIGIARGTVQRYLSALAQEGGVSLHYGSAGGPNARA